MAQPVVHLEASLVVHPLAVLQEVSPALGAKMVPVSKRSTKGLFDLHSSFACCRDSSQKLDIVL